METAPKRSWIDRLVDRVARLPVPWYVLALVAWLVLSSVLASPLWLDGSEPFGSYPRITRVDPTYLLGAFFGYGYLARYARRAFDRFRPALDVPDETAAVYRHRISTLSPRVAWAMVVLGASAAVLSTLTDEFYASFLTTAIARATWSAFALMAGIFPLVLTLIVKQLRLVARLHREATHIDLFRPAPFHAFAGLSARAGGMMLLWMTFAVLTDPAVFASAVWGAVVVAGIAFSAVVFLFPLIGLSRRLRAEKRRLLDESSGRIGSIRQELHRAVESRSFDSGGELRTMLSALSEDHDRIRRLSPWPWDTATVRGFATTLLVPIGTWLVTNLLNRALF